jgi:Mn-dependent DtxR family transcriptional regulator
LKEIGKVLKSDLAMDILLLSDGTKNTTEISKILKKSIATISTYANRLKKMNLIRMISNDKLKRNLEGIKINFDFLK